MNEKKSNIFPLLTVSEIEELYQELEERFDRVDQRLTAIERSVRELLDMVKSSRYKNS
jgi:hypothetical protein